MNAEEARQNTLNYFKYTKEFQDIIKLIDDASCIGKNSIKMKSLSSDFIYTLERLNYTVSQHFDLKEHSDIYTISW